MRERRARHLLSAGINAHNRQMGGILRRGLRRLPLCLPVLVDSVGPRVGFHLVETEGDQQHAYRGQNV